MNKAYRLVYIVNILLGISFCFLYLFFINNTPLSIAILIGISIFYILSVYKFFRRKLEIQTIDFIVINLYLISIMSMFIYNFISQGFYDAFSFIYYNYFIYIIHLLFVIYNYFK